MSRTLYVGKAGQLAVMGELALRGYNVAIPEIDEGDDAFVVRNDTGAMWRIQVKTSSEKRQQRSSRYSFRIQESSIQQPQNPELHFVFVMRRSETWRFLVMDRPVLRNYVQSNGIGTLHHQHRQVNIVLHDDGRAICSGVDWQNHLEDWATWPKI